VAMTFGADLEDVTTDPDELRRLLEPGGDGDDQAEEELAADPDPGWEPPGFGERLAGAARGKGPAPKKITAAVKKDVQGKVALLSHLVASGWQARDPLCGAAAVEAVPEFSEALTDILCDSPDIVAWFTSGGSYMKWLRLLMTLQPVATVAFQHHIAHTITLDEDAQPQDWSGYAAG
jgi:hypothetical protein